MTESHKEFLLAESKRYANIADAKTDYVVAAHYRNLAAKYKKFATMED